MILPFYGFLDRIDQNLLEAGRDLGGSPVSTFVRVTLPLSKPAILAGLVIVTLPMFGDYYTNNLLSNSPKTTMLGKVLDDAIESPGKCPLGPVFVLYLYVRDPDLHQAIFQTLKLSLGTMLVAVPIGVMFAIGIDRWHSRPATTANFVMLLSFVMPEIIIGVALFLVFQYLLKFIHLG